METRRLTVVYSEDDDLMREATIDVLTQEDVDVHACASARTRALSQHRRRRLTSGSNQAAAFFARLRWAATFARLPQTDILHQRRPWPRVRSANHLTGHGLEQGKHPA